MNLTLGPCLYSWYSHEFLGYASLGQRQVGSCGALARLDRFPESRLWPAAAGAGAGAGACSGCCLGILLLVVWLVLSGESGMPQVLGNELFGV